VVSILVYIWIIICITVICPAKFNVDENDLDFDSTAEVERMEINV
jgi:hypothetical protein